ncbi:MAG: ArsA family ATPase [Actinobacteria bacterium]|nr:ArsA family ATPase [Actinomycetota bacterium]NBP53065.1 ArsA family ATPase [Actinomycetota bacterium]
MARTPGCTVTSGVLDSVLTTARVVVVAGSGGVGKTTVSAAIAAQAALDGRRVAVVTIDPAKRLADALGFGAGQPIGNDPVRIPLDGAHGELWALMLDTRSTFDALVDRYSPSTDQAERIRSNLFYRNISGALSGTQEYMAAEKLYELHGDERFDLVVVDTPPTRQALDFLSAPARLRRFIDHPLYRIVIAPSSLGLRAVNAVSQPVLRTIARVVGAQALDDALAFFRAFQGLDAGFRERAHDVDRVLHEATTKYVVVTSAQAEPVAEAGFFISELESQGVGTSLVVANRLMPDFGSADDVSYDSPDPLRENLRELTAERHAEELVLLPLRTRLAQTPWISVELVAELLDERHDTLAAIRRLGSVLGTSD